MFAVFDAEALVGAGVADGVDIVGGQCRGIARRVRQVAMVVFSKHVKRCG